MTKIKKTDSNKTSSKSNSWTTSQSNTNTKK